jgi:hypothetical protein
LEGNRLDSFDVEDKFKEIDIQIKMMNALPNWLSALKGLKESEQAKMELRGGGEMSAATQIIMERK